jgi:DMSO reductase anchor subunit
MQPIKIRLLLDFGLVVLIWIVQLIIYPSFQFYTPEELLPWHSKYTVAISFIVIPLMLGQLVVSALQFVRHQNFYTISSLIVVCLIWTLTFTIFVPLHNSIASDSFTADSLESLVQNNWSRTFLWSALFLWSFYNYVKLNPINLSSNSS